MEDEVGDRDFLFHLLFCILFLYIVYLDSQNIVLKILLVESFLNKIY